MKKSFSLLIIIACAVVIMIVMSNTGCGKQEKNYLEFNSATDVLTQIYENTDDTDKLPIVGGDSKHQNMDLPDYFDPKNTDEAESMLNISHNVTSKVDDMASMIHMMNANTFTCASYHLDSEKNLNNVIESIKKDIENQRWICGSPNNLVIAYTGNNYIVSAYGITEVMDDFKVTIKNMGMDILVDIPIE